MSNRQAISQNPLPWVSIVRCHAYLGPIIRVLKVLNCSVNFFVYRFLLSKEKKLQQKRKTKRQIQMEPLNATNSTNTSSSTQATPSD